MGADGVTDTAIEVNGLGVSFAGRGVLCDIDLDLPGRSITVVIGRSGSGKTTLLRALNRLNECFPECHTRGEVHVRLGSGLVPVYGPGAPAPEQLRRRVGMVFQTPNLLPLSVERNMLLPLRLVAELPGSEQRARVEHALRQAQLWDEVKDRLRDDAASLSVGQQQRLCLARTLALQPDILLLDEPTASVDHATTGRIEQVLQRLKCQYAIMMVSHSLSQARRLADCLVVLRCGRVARRLGREEIDRGQLLEESGDEQL